MMPYVSQVPTIFLFQRNDFWPGWHPLHARNSALEVILPSLLSNPPSSFSSTESFKSTAAMRRAFGAKFHPTGPRTQGKSRSRSSSRGLSAASSRLPLCAPKFLPSWPKMNSLKRKNSRHLRHIRHQNTKTSLYETL